MTQRHRRASCPPRAATRSGTACTSATTRTASRDRGRIPASTSRSATSCPAKQAIQYTKDHIERLPLVAAARVGRLWGLFKPGQTTALDWWIEGRGRAASWIGLFAYYALLPFAFYGLVDDATPTHPDPAAPRRRAGRDGGRGRITFGVTRYRAPAEVALVVAAADRHRRGLATVASRRVERTVGGTVTTTVEPRTAGHDAAPSRGGRSSSGSP